MRDESLKAAQLLIDKLKIELSSIALNQAHRPASNALARNSSSCETAWPDWRSGTMATHIMRLNCDSSDSVCVLADAHAAICIAPTIIAINILGWSAN